MSSQPFLIFIIPFYIFITFIYIHSISIHISFHYQISYLYNSFFIMLEYNIIIVILSTNSLFSSYCSIYFFYFIKRLQSFILIICSIFVVIQHYFLNIICYSNSFEIILSFPKSVFIFMNFYKWLVTTNFYLLKVEFLIITSAFDIIIDF